MDRIAGSARSRRTLRRKQSKQFERVQLAGHQGIIELSLVCKQRVVALVDAPAALRKPGQVTQRCGGEGACSSKGDARAQGVWWPERERRGQDGLIHAWEGF
eukprot:scaffold1496_cov110-Isochrysis_galbana.AAC.9